MLSEDFNYLLVPGLGGIELQHWMRHWKRAYPFMHILRQKDFQHPVMEVWVETLSEKVQSLSDKPIILIAHSLGCATALHANSKNLIPGVVAAQLIAIPEESRPEFHNGEWKGFLPYPKTALPFPSHFVYSENDAYCTVSNMLTLAEQCNGIPANAGENGHLGSSANLKNWDFGIKNLVSLHNRISN